MAKFSSFDAPQGTPGPINVRKATADDFGGSAKGLQAAGKALGKIGEKFKAAEDRLNARKESLHRNAISEQATLDSRDVLDDARTSLDLSRDEDIALVSSKLAEISQTALAQYQGNEEGRLILQEDLQKMRFGFLGDVAQDSVTINLERSKKLFGERLNQSRARVALNPDLLDNEIKETREFLKNNRGSFNPQTEAGFEQAILAETADAAFTTYMITGRRNMAESVLAREDVRAAFGENRMQEAVKLLNTADAKRAEALTKIGTAMAQAQALLPEGTDEDRQRVAFQLMGIDPTQKLKFFPFGNKVLVMNQKGEKVSVMTIPEGEGTYLDTDKKKAVGFPEDSVVFQPNDGGPPQELHKGGKTIERIEAEEAAKSQGKLLGTANGMKAVLEAAGYDQELIAGVTEELHSSNAIAKPFQDGSEPSGDSKRVAMLVATSRRLLAAGQVSMANGMIQQAKLLASTSLEMAREKENDKPISMELAREFGLPIGTPMGEALTKIGGRLPLSPADLAATKSEATATAKAKVKGQETIAFVNEAESVVDSFLEKLSVDPKLGGLIGGLRATGQNLIQIFNDFGAGELVITAKELAFSESNAPIDDVLGWFDDKTLSVLDIMTNSIGLILARIRTPTGRIPVDVIKRSIKDTNLAGFQGSKVVRNRLEFIKELLGQRRENVKSRFKRTGGRVLPVLELRNGKLVNVETGLPPGVQQ
jgi:hypothetical protein